MRDPAAWSLHSSFLSGPCLLGQQQHGAAWQGRAWPCSDDEELCEWELARWMRRQACCMVEHAMREVWQQRAPSPLAPGRGRHAQSQRWRQQLHETELADESRKRALRQAFRRCAPLRWVSRLVSHDAVVLRWPRDLWRRPGSARVQAGTGVSGPLPAISDLAYAA